MKPAANEVPERQTSTRVGSASLLLFLLAALAPVLAEASVPRTAAADVGALRAASLAEPSRLDLLTASDDVERFALFADDDLARELARGSRTASALTLAPGDAGDLALASRVREESFSLHLGADVFGLEPLRGPPPLSEDLCQGDDECLAGTRIGGLGLSGPFFTEGQPRLSLELQWACGVSSSGLAYGKPLDPWGLVASVSLSGVIVGQRPDGSRYRVEPGTDPVDALRILESDSEITTAAEQEDILDRARMSIPRSSAQRPGEAVLDSREPNYRQFTHYPSGGSWFEAALIATTGLPPQTREQEIASSVVGMAAAAAPAVAGPIARAKGGVGVAIDPAEFPQFGPSPRQEPPVVEPYDRRKHYGNTPTVADRKAVGGSPDHTPPLVRRYYEGDPATGEKPGLLMTPEQRKASARDRDRMKPSTRRDQNKQGGAMSKYSKEMKRRLGLD